VFEVLKKMVAGYVTYVRDLHHRFQITAAGIATAGTSRGGASCS
jgi:hypothetical protein